MRLKFRQPKVWWAHARFTVERTRIYEVSLRKQKEKVDKGINHRWSSLSIKKTPFYFHLMQVLKWKFKKTLWVILFDWSTAEEFFLYKDAYKFSEIIEGIRRETILIVDCFQANLAISRGSFLCKKKSTSNKQMNFKMIGMHFCSKLSKQENLIAWDGNYMPHKSIKQSKI